MKKIHFALCSILLLASCGASNQTVDGKSYIDSFSKAYDASYSAGSYFMTTTSSGVTLALGVRNLNETDDTYYHIEGSGLTFDIGAKGLKGSDASDLEGELVLKGGTLSLKTDAKETSAFSDFMKISPVKAKAYFDGGALYLDASGNKNSETNSTIGLALQTLIQKASGDSDYSLVGGGSVITGGTKYKGKWALKDEDKQKISDKMPLVKDGETLSDYFSLSSLIEGAYEDPNGATAFSFVTKEDGTKRIVFDSKDKTVLTGALTAGFASFSDTLDKSESVPSKDEVKEKVEKFFTYATPTLFRIETLFTDKGVSQITYDINFTLDEGKVKEAHPDGMIDLSENASSSDDPNDYKFNLDGSLTFSGTLRTSFGSGVTFSLPDLSGYKDFPVISKGSEE